MKIMASLKFWDRNWELKKEDKMLSWEESLKKRQRKKVGIKAGVERNRKHNILRLFYCITQ